MKMSAWGLIRKSLKNRPFSTKEAEGLGVTRYALKKLEAQGAIEKIAHGLYVLATGDITYDERFKRATFRVGEPSLICLLSALEFYNLTDLITKEVWIMVPANKRTHQKDIRIFRAANLKLNVGVKKQRGFSITSIERTIVDSLTHQRQLPVTVGTEALRRAIQLKETTLSKIVDVAKELGVFHRIRPYIEALA